MAGFGERPGVTKGRARRTKERQHPFVVRLLRWYRKHRRALPWREDVNAYCVWVSEVMLQQTRVDVVTPYFERFVDRFPTVNDLAQAKVDDVVALWSGLGYYRRARSLHAGARHVVDNHDGEFPRDYSEALKVPGVGPYTAGAILSIAYGLPVPVVDGNVERVMTRVQAIPGNPKSGPVSRRLREAGGNLIPRSAAGDFNQALMELGATVCTPPGTKCNDCPVESLCAARKNDDVSRFPEVPAARKPVPVTLQAAIVRHRRRYLVERVTKGSFLKGMWVFPFVESTEVDPLLTHLRNEFEQKFSVASRLANLRHSITFRKITVSPSALETTAPISIQDKERFRWARLNELGNSIPVSSLTLKIRAAIETQLDSSGEVPE